MADLIKIKGGNGTVPVLQDRELAYRKDEKALYIGTESGNVRLCGEGDAEAIDALRETISGLNVTIAAQGATIEAMKKQIEDITARLDTVTNE